MKCFIFFIITWAFVASMSPNYNGKTKLSTQDEKKEEDRARSVAVAAKVIDAAQLTLGYLQQVLNIMGSVKRKIAIGVTNEASSGSWEGLNVYFRSGTSDTTIPEFVKPKEALIYNARKTNGPTATGSVGVVAYYMKDVDKTLAVLFSVPFDYNWYSNWWNAKVYPGKKRASYDMYNELYNYNGPFKGDNGWHSKAIGGGFRVKGIMTSAGSCKLEVKIFK